MTIDLGNRNYLHTVTFQSKWKIFQYSAYRISLSIDFAVIVILINKVYTMMNAYQM